MRCLVVFILFSLDLCFILQTWLHLSKAEGQFYGDLKSGKQYREVSGLKQTDEFLLMRLINHSFPIF